MQRLCFLSALLLSLLWASVAAGSGWKATIVDHPRLPPKFLAVDKNTQKLLIYERQSPLRLLSTFPCTTGQSDGDKQLEDDLRTPEGVYFVEGRKRGDLDWELYGNLAYPLNYPNPIDRLRGKTGYGIWVHGRGKKLVPRDTRGCVAMNTNDLKGLGDDMQFGLPVIISDRVQVAESEAPLSPEVSRDLDEAVSLVGKWARDWETGSDEFFSHYDPKRFSKTGDMSFERFKGHKRGLFKRYPWIRVMAYDVRAVPGPDYVVTYFRQYYRTPTLATEGIKRLYWMRDKGGQLRIVGREWKRTERTLDNEFLASARKQIAPAIEAWREAWAKADIAHYMDFYDKHAIQGERVDAKAIREQKIALWDAAPPRHVAFLSPKYTLVPEGVEVTFGQTYIAHSGYEDHGIKTILLAPAGAGWKILREDWRPL